MSGKMRVVAVLAIVGVIAGIALAAWAQGRSPAPRGRTTDRRPTPPRNVVRDRSPGGRPFQPVPLKSAERGRARSPGERSPGERSPGERSPGERRGGSPPKAFVVQFRHISVESFMNTLEQLARNGDIRKVLEQVPHAVNEEANAVVFIASRELAEFIMPIAHELDRPNEFRLHSREMEMREIMINKQIETIERGGPIPGGPRPQAGPCGGRCGGKCGGCGRAGAPPKKPGAPPGCGKAAPGAPKKPGKPAPSKHAASKKPGKPAPPKHPAAAYNKIELKAMALTSPKIVAHLKLGPEQVKRIHGLIADYLNGLQQLHSRAGTAMKNAPPDRRREMAEGIRKKIAADREERTRELNRKILGMMGVEQRGAAARILGLDAPIDRPKASPSGPGKA